MTKIKETLPFAVEQSAKYPVAIIDRNGDYIAEEVSDDDAQFIVTACNNYERLKAENKELRSHIRAIGVVAVSCESQHYQFGRIGKIVNMALKEEGE